MNPGDIRWVRSFIALAAAIAAFPLLAFAEVAVEGAARFESNIGSRKALEVDEKAKEQVNKMSPEEVRELDAKLARALTFFYDARYSKALPIFREISAKVETMDIMFWYASCAAKAGELEAAVEKFKQMLEIDPGLHRVRLELATTYFLGGEYDLARDSLETVSEAGPPDAVKMNIERLIEAIDEKSRKYRFHARASQSITWDSNVSAGPDREIIGLPNGGSMTLDESDTEVDDWLTITNVSGNVLYDMGDRGGLMWNTAGYFYQTLPFEHHNFDLTNIRLTSGPWWVTGNSVFKLPVGYARYIYGHDDLFDTFDFGPGFEYFPNRNVSIRAAVSFVRDSYASDSRDGRDNKNWVFELNPSFYFNDRNDIISISISSENLNAREDRYTYDAINLAVSYFRRFDRGMEFYVRYKYSDRNYEGPALLWDEDREDERHHLYAALSRDLCEYLFASLYVEGIDNDSNTGFYDTEKFSCGLRIGFKF